MKRIQQRVDPEEDRLSLWLERYLDEQFDEERQRESKKKVKRQLLRFIEFMLKRYGHEKVTTVIKRDVEAWIDFLYDKKNGMAFAAAHVNNHLWTLSPYMKWLRAAAPYLLTDNPTKGVRDILLPAPEPRTYTPEQIHSLKNICDRLERFHLKTDRRRAAGKYELKEYARPKRDRALIYVFMSTGLRRAEIVQINLDQIVPNDPKKLRKADIAYIEKIRGKGKTEGIEYLGKDARLALADYLEHERPVDASEESEAVFLSAVGTSQRNPDGRLYPRTINGILAQIGRWHDAEFTDPLRHISPLQPHRLRHTFGNELAKKPGVTREDLKRALRHRNERYLDIYTNPPRERSASFVEEL
jgi:integrase/recombinase XerC